MEFGLAIISTIEVKNKSTIIQTLSDELELFIKSKKYGNDVKSFTIGIVCIAPQFEKFFKEKKPKYTKGVKIINPDGIPFKLEDSLEYSIKLDFETFKNGTEEACKKLLAKEILNSLSVVESMKNKIKDFDLEKFKADLERYFKEKELI